MGNSGTWQNDCLVENATTKKKELKVKTNVKCNLAEFTAYIKGYDQRIDLAMQRLDKATNKVFTTITSQMKDLVNNYVWKPIVSMADGVTCGFMPKFYRGMIDGMCFQGVVGWRSIGKSYVLLAMAVFLMACVSFVLWR